MYPASDVSRGFLEQRALPCFAVLLSSVFAARELPIFRQLRCDDLFLRAVFFLKTRYFLLFSDRTGMPSFFSPRLFIVAQATFREPLPLPPPQRSPFCFPSGSFFLPSFVLSGQIGAPRNALKSRISPLFLALSVMQPRRSGQLLYLSSSTPLCCFFPPPDGPFLRPIISL